MGFPEGRLRIDVDLRLQLAKAAPAGLPERPVDDLAGRHPEAAVFRSDPLGDGADDLMVGAALARRLDELGPELDVLVAAAPIDVVVLHEHGRGQDDVGHQGRLGHELLVDADEQVLAGKAPLHQFLLGRDGDRVRVLDDHRRDGRTVTERRPDRR